MSELDAKSLSRKGSQRLSLQDFSLLTLHESLSENKQLSMSNAKGFSAVLCVFATLRQVQTSAQETRLGRF
jgi:hypothetical protein